MTTVLDEQMKAAEKEWEEGWRLGPQRVRWITTPPQVGDTAPDFSLVDSNNMPTRLSNLWQTRPLLILFWRHFGCSCGVDRAGRLQKEYNDYKASGGSVIVIGQGEPERARAYAEKYGLPCPILCDPKFQAYEAFGLLEGTPAQILFDAPEALLARDYSAGMKMVEERRAQNRPLVDSPWQLPGEFVIDREGIIRLAYRYNFCEDWPDARVLTAALRDAGKPFAGRVADDAKTAQLARPAEVAKAEDPAAVTQIAKAGETSPMIPRPAEAARADPAATQPSGSDAPTKHGTGRLGEGGPV